MFLRNSNSIKSVKILNHYNYTTEMWPPEANYIFDDVKLEITYQNGSKNEKRYTRKTAMWLYGDHFSQEDLDTYYEGKKGFVFSPTKTAAIGATTLLCYSFGGVGFFGGAFAGYVVSKAVEKVSENCSKRSM